MKVKLYAVLDQASGVYDGPVPAAADGVAMRYTSPTLERLWGYGFVDVGDLTFGSASYVAGYVLKKVKGIPAEDHYMTYDMDGEITFISPEFVGMSRGNNRSKGQRCGIGAGWLAKYKRDIISGEVPVPGKGVMHGVPRYYDEIIKEDDPILHEQIKDIRREFMRAHADEYTPERLQAKHDCKKARVALFDERKL
jgi:hypothetical protein